MNLPYVHKLLLAASSQRHGFLKLRGRQADHEVRLMASAGLIDATFNDRNGNSFISINRLTELGHKFLRAFKNQSLPGVVTSATPVPEHLPPGVSG